MNTNPEEQALLADAAQLRRERMQISDTEASKAIRRGFANRSATRKRRYLPYAVAAAVLALLLGAGWWRGAPIGSLPALHSAKDGDWGVLAKYEPLSDVDHATLESAVRNDYIQIVNKSASSGPYRITLDAVTADENKMLLFYTAKADSGQEIKAVNSVKVTDLNSGRPLNAELQISNEDVHSWSALSTVILDRSQPFPSRIEVDFQVTSVNPGKLGDPKTGAVAVDFLYSDRMKIYVDLEPKFEKTQTVVMQPDRSISIDGHKVVLSKVEISPLMTLATFTVDPGSTTDPETRRSIRDKFRYMNIVSTNRDGRVVQLSPVSGSGTDEGFQQIFSSSMLDKPRSLVLKMYLESDDTGTPKPLGELPVVEMKIK
ncbi:hypothetical protein FHS19_000223 [Paenibacillus rhizosphaerae]|uniref:DUF5643 domain-containing protein n=1 Tax=Paenibacillus rhizosphaerae TaxID=297318 RepID=A0A839TJP2_9BACL|nr:DUF4179 domain-containing protein [Paenibacillus rhizosphaerae]MBB3125569.1 hypothetical protein [Paenibacillus rhizosphaerae]